MKRQYYFSLFFLLSLQAACLKTRSQLKQEEGPIPAKVEPVQQGGYAIEEMKHELTRLTGRIEELEQAQKNSDNSSQKESIKELEKRIEELEENQETVLETLKKIQSEGHASDTTEHFFKGKELFKKSKMNEAIKSFNAYLKNPNGKHAMEAFFLRAEAYFATKAYKKAILDYSKFPEKYSNSQYTPKALLKIALSFEFMGLKEDAVAFYEQLLDEFPKSSEAKEARKKLGIKKPKS